MTTSEAGTAGKESKACAEISALVNYVMPVHFRTFEHAEKRRRSYEMSSFVETTALSLLKEDPVDFVKYNRFQASRIYPRGTRFASMVIYIDDITSPTSGWIAPTTCPRSTGTLVVS